ncbi:peptidoglycan-binding protein [Candidatus Kaiserbacteria bacterium]|nr:peptidoglycan-binding protein [Candidatus Kaiserbacteria bacterium]
MHNKQLTTWVVVVLLATPLLTQALTPEEKNTFLIQLITQVLELQKQIVALGGAPVAIPANLSGLVQQGGGSAGGAAASAVTCTLSRTLALGAKGDDVTCLQRFLIAQNLLAPDSATGYFGPLTRAAVRRFQQAQNLEQVGHVGKLTRAHINQVRSTALATNALLPPPAGGAVSQITTDAGERESASSFADTSAAGAPAVLGTSTTSTTSTSTTNNALWVTIGAPKDGATVSGGFTIGTRVSTTTIGTQFKIDGKNYGGEDKRVPSPGIGVNFGSFVNGPHALSAVVRDAAGNRATSTVNVIFANYIPPPVATPAPSTYGSTQNIVLATSTATSTLSSISNYQSIVHVRYVTDGSNPTCTTSPIYTKPIVASTTKTIKAISCYLAVSSPVATFTYSIVQSGTTFTFNLNTAATTSAGVYQNGTLIKTLWSNVQYSAGAHTATWDGTKDGGAVAPGGIYEVRILSNNVRYSWDVIGNTSTSFTDSTTLHAQDVIYGMAITGSTIYYTTAYNEARSGTFKTSVSNPQAKTIILPTAFHYTGPIALYVATDGNYVYWDGMDWGGYPNVNNHVYVYATKVSDDTMVKFLSGTDVTIGVAGPDGVPRKYSAINNLDVASSTITGLAVQKSGDYLFVAHGDLNKIDVLNKTTGAFVRAIAMTAPRKIATDMSGNLWVITGSETAAVVQKYTVAADGSLSAISNLKITGLSKPLTLAISPDNATLLVADGGTSHQVKAFSNTTASSTWIYGKPGGYLSDPNVAVDKFSFHNFNNITFRGGVDWTFLTYAPDGSFWVGDSGNDRSQHFSASRTLLESVSWVPLFYNTAVDPNNPQRIFAGFLEFAVDYAKPQGPNTGSWKLVKNWGIVKEKLPPQYVLASKNVFAVPFGMTTLNNGRTYGLLRNFQTAKFDVVEFPEIGTLRFTSASTPNYNYTLYKDGSLHVVNRPKIGESFEWRKKPLTGFTAAGDPQWGLEKVVGTSPILASSDDHYNLPSGGSFVPWEMTNSGIIVSFDARSPVFTGAYATDPVDHKGYHLAGLDTNTGTWRWKTAPSTGIHYCSEWPGDGTFNNNERVYVAGSFAHAVDNNIFWHYQGEGWKCGRDQSNMWTHVSDDGLMIGEFGTVEQDLPNGQENEGQAGLAGNAAAQGLVKGPDGAIYVYQNDEGWHGGIHRWKIDNLSSISEQKIPVNWDAAKYVPRKDPTDLLAGLPYDSSVADDTAGWRRTPATDTTNNLQTDWWKVITSLKNYPWNKHLYDSPDIDILFAHRPAANATVTRDLGTPDASTTSWMLTGAVVFASGLSGSPNMGDYEGMYFDVLDDAGKVISRLYTKQVTANDYRVFANNQVIFQMTEFKSFLLAIRKVQPFSIKANGGNVTITYGSYTPVTTPTFDSTANWRKPKTIKLYFWSTAGGYNHGINFSKLNFISN